LSAFSTNLFNKSKTKFEIAGQLSSTKFSCDTLPHLSIRTMHEKKARRICGNAISGRRQVDEIFLARQRRSTGALRRSKAGLVRQPQQD